MKVFFTKSGKIVNTQNANFFTNNKQNITTNSKKETSKFKNITNN